jgi:hypothetical protein
MKQTVENTNKWKLSHVHGLKEYLYYIHTTQSNVRFNTNPYLNSNGIFHKSKGKIVIFHT